MNTWDFNYLNISGVNMHSPNEMYAASCEELMQWYKDALTAHKYIAGADSDGQSPLRQIEMYISSIMTIISQKGCNNGYGTVLPPKSSNAAELHDNSTAISSSYNTGIVPKSKGGSPVPKPPVYGSMSTASTAMTAHSQPLQDGGVVTKELPPLGAPSMEVIAPSTLATSQPPVASGSFVEPVVTNGVSGVVAVPNNHVNNGWGMNGIASAIAQKIDYFTHSAPIQTSPTKTPPVVSAPISTAPTKLTGKRRTFFGWLLNGMKP